MRHQSVTAAALLTASTLVLGLTACAPQDDDAASYQGPDLADCAPSGPASDSVEIDGDFGGELTWAFDDAIEVSGIERSVLIDGAGDEGAVAGQTVNAYYTVFDGSTGKILERGADVSSDPVPFLNDSGLYSAGMVAALTCSTDGSRVVAVMPAESAFGDNVEALGLTETTPIVLVLDVDSVEDTVLPEAPEVETVERDASLSAPAVDLTSTVPVVTLPESAPPSQFQLEVLEAGDGETVADGASVTVDYHGVSWDTATVFDSSYVRGAPATFLTGEVIAGFRDAIVGQAVGSTVLAVIPPAMAYGEDPTAHRLGGQTLVFVVHIVAAQ